LALFVLEKGEGEIQLHPLAQPLIQEFKDVFPTDNPRVYLKLEVLSIKSTC